MWEQWKDYRLDEAPSMYKSAKKTALKDIESLESNMKMMIKESDKEGDRKKAIEIMKVYKNVVTELKMLISKM
jgi:hypothetical protein